MMMCISRSLRSLLAVGLVVPTLGALLAAPAEADQRWTEERATQWSKSQPWLIGCNFAPSTACNQIEMWQDFDEPTIDRELGWAKAIGMNTVRVFLHDQCWKADPASYLAKIDAFLQIADGHEIRTMLVLFDGVWDPDPRLGPQGPTREGVHNSKWVQGPGRKVLANAAKQDSLQPYVTSVVDRFAEDPRVVVWDLFNEPDNDNVNSYGPLELANKDEMAARLVRLAFKWARGKAPSQPLTVGVWRGPAWDMIDELNQVHQAALELSDVITFHNYDPPESMMQRIEQLRTYNRPLICTEFMARGNGSTFEAILPMLLQNNVGAYCWGLVDGRTQTKQPWTTWQVPNLEDPTPWHHEVLHSDGSPYSKAETDLIQSLSPR
ncbi:MAG: cellulase family glycosylhydrolase [Pirellulales bacterium]|nr:cellulase family glycosylhydrolase [Pirellulales bacterium]